jgi:hypothetical protein
MDDIDIVLDGPPLFFACCHTITGYSGNSICPYSFQIPNLQ